MRFSSPLWPLTVFLACGSGSAPVERSFTEVHLGVPVRITVYHTDSLNLRRGARDAFETMARLEAVFSHHRDDSEIARLLARGGGTHRVSDHLMRVLVLADRFVHASDGAFDPSVGALTAGWREAHRTQDTSGLGSGSTGAGWPALTIDDDMSTVTLAGPGLSLDLSGIAKGYIVDRAADRLRAHGIHRFMIVAGGDVKLGDPPPDRAGWYVAIQDATRPGRVDTLANTAIGTSGDTEQFIQIGDRRYSHLIDPRTGRPLTDVRIVTVLASSSAVADAAATAIRVGGPGTTANVRRAFPDVRLLLIAQ